MAARAAVVTARLCAILYLLGPSCFAATATLKAVRINGTPIAPSADVSVAPGDRILTEMYIFGWDESSPGSTLHAYSFFIDGMASYDSGGSGLILPAGWNAPPGLSPCITDADCSYEAPACQMGACQIPCFPSCPTAFPNCLYLSTGHRCVGANHTQSVLAQFAFINTQRSDFAMFGWNPAASTTHLPHDISYGFGALTPGLGRLDPGPPGLYAGTLTLDVQFDASGTFTVRFRPAIMNYIPAGASPATIRAVLPSLVPLVIRVGGGACCDTLTGSCTESGETLCGCAQCQWTPDATCAEVTCENPVIPAVSEWGMVILALSLLVLIKVDPMRSPGR